MIILSKTAQTPIATEGMHQGVKVGETVFDNIHTAGIPYKEWIADFEALTTDIRAKVISTF